MKTLCYALFHCDPSVEPPFTLDLGFRDKSVHSITECAHIPDAVEKMEAYCAAEGAEKSASFTLLYPIYLEAMDTDDEDTMHAVASLVKEQADKHNWKFNRTGGYTGNSVDTFGC